MGYVRRGQQLVIAAMIVMLGSTLIGCGRDDDAGASSDATKSSSAPMSSDTSGGSRSPQSASPNPSASGGWWPEQSETMATGQKFPENYEPATLEHPARNVPKPQFPEAAKYETEAGARAFLDYYAYVGWYAYQTGDSSYMRAIVAPECKACFTEMDLVDEIYGNGDWCAGSDERDEILPRVFRKNELGYYSIPVATTNNGAKLISKNRVVRDFMPFDEDDRFNVNIDFRDGHWTYITASPRNQS